jgi:hypothetical protein
MLRFDCRFTSLVQNRPVIYNNVDTIHDFYCRAYGRRLVGGGMEGGKTPCIMS